MAQEVIGPLDLALGQQGADIGGGDGDSIQLNFGDDVAAHAQPGALLPQPVGVALSLVAEVEVVPRHEMDRAVLPHQKLGDEVLPGHVHHPVVEVGHNDLPDAVVTAHQLRPVQGGVDQRHGAAENQVLRVGVEGDGGGGGPQLRRLTGHPAQQGPVAPVHPVEKAQCDNSFLFVHS